jgi:glyoxylase-like metal-dependent hydrolase (beta-lactamase superfamily II)
MEEFMKIKNVTDRVVIADTQSSNAGAVALKNFIVAIDPTVVPATAKVFREKIEKQYNLPVKHILITHYHSDHVLGIEPFKDANVISTVFLKEEVDKKLASGEYKGILKDWMKNRPEMGLTEDVEIISPNQTFEDKMVIEDGDLKVEFYHTGGHTEGSSFAYFPFEKVLFAGDLIFARMFPWAGDPSCNPDLWIDAFEKILTLDFEYLIPGHGELAGREEVEIQLKFFKKLRELIKATVKEGKKVKDIAIPEFYKPMNESMFERSLEHWFQFYK